MAHRLNVTFYGSNLKTLESLAIEKGMSVPEVIRRALSVYDYAVRQTQQYNLSITQNGKILKNVVVP